MDDAEEDWPAVVPELVVRDLDASVAFWCDTLGFRVRFKRPEDGFAYLEQGRAHIMLERLAEGAWLTGAMEPPFGRGINLQIEVADAAAIHDRVAAAGVAPFRPLRTNWYREGDRENGQAEFLVQDPDGYLLRFMQHLGDRPAR